MSASRSRRTPHTVKDCKNLLLFAHIKATEECRKTPTNMDIPALLQPPGFIQSGYLHSFSNHNHPACKAASEAVIELANHCMTLADRNKPGM